MSYTVPEFFEAYDRGDFDKLAPKCADCKQPFKEGEPLGPYKTKRGMVCSDCYFKVFGEEVEKHPICAPRKRGKH
jgi:DNA-directed RNA polymerase subunit RPC12/RpoP